MTMTIRFSPDLLYNFDTLKNFFNGKDAIGQLQEEIPPREPPFEWNESLMAIYSIFARIVSDAFFLFSMWDLGEKWLLKSKWAEIRPDFYFRKIFGQRFLVRSVNLPPLDGAASPPSIEVSPLFDFRVRKLLPTELKLLQFNSGEGGCLGGSEWMMSLYFRTTVLFDDARQHLIALARLFRKGLPIEAQVLQAFDNDDVLSSPHLGFFKQHYFTIANSKPFEEKLTWAAAALYSAPRGVYAINLPGHRVTWFKPKKTISYLHCENIGLVEISDIEHYVQACSVLLSTYNNFYNRDAMKIMFVRNLESV